MFKLENGKLEIIFKNKFRVVIDNELDDEFTSLLLKSKMSISNIVRVKVLYGNRDIADYGEFIDVTKLVINEIITREEEESEKFNNTYYKYNSDEFKYTYLDASSYLELLKFVKRYKDYDSLLLKISRNLEKRSLAKKKNSFQKLKVDGEEYIIIKAAYSYIDGEHIKWGFVYLDGDLLKMKQYDIYAGEKWNELCLLDFSSRKSSKKIPTASCRNNIKIYGHNLKLLLTIVLEKLSKTGNETTQETLKRCDRNEVINIIYKKIQTNYSSLSNMPACSYNATHLFTAAKNNTKVEKYVEVIISRLDILTDVKINTLPIVPSSLKCRAWYEKDTLTEVFSFSIGCIGEHDKTETEIKRNIQLINDWLYEKFSQRLQMHGIMPEEIYNYCMQNVKISRILFTKSNLLEYTLLIPNCSDLSRMYLYPKSKEVKSEDAVAE